MFKIFTNKKLEKEFDLFKTATEKEIKFLKEQIHLLKNEICDLKNCNEQE